MSLDTILDSIATGISTAVPVLKVCEVVGGSINVAEVLRRSRQLPAAFVFCVGTNEAREVLDKVKTTGLFAVVLVVKASAEAPPETKDRAHVAARIAGRLISAVAKGGTWSNDEVETKPQKVDSRNKYTTDGDNRGVALWAVSWEQSLALTLDPPPGELDNLETILATYELQDGTTPAVDAIDEIDMTP